MSSETNSFSLKLEDLRERLIRQEETIIFALIERAQWAENSEIYTPGAIELPSEHNGASFLDYFFAETERVHAYCRRYTSPDEHPFYPNKLPPPILPLLSFKEVIKPNTINLNQKIKQIYLEKFIPRICTEKHDSQYGSSTASDVSVLQALSKRIHYGKFVAEAKFQSEPQVYLQLIEKRNADGIMEKLTNVQVEEKLLERVKLKASTYGKDIVFEKSEHYKLQPQIIVELYRDFIIPLTKEVQVQYLLERNNPSVSYLGPEGTFSHQVAQKFFAKSTSSSHSIKYQSCQEIREVFLEVLAGRARYGIVPIENSQTGVIHQHLSLLIESDVKVIAEVYLPISFAVLSKSSSFENIKVIYSHAQGFLQCQSWLKSNVPGAKLVPVASTANGAEIAVRDDTTAVLGSLQLSQKYGLPILATGVEEAKNNKTRFFVISSMFGEPSGKDKSILTFGLKNEPGALSSVLQIFSKQHVNLTAIQSFPDKLNFSYGFFVELEGHVKNKEVATALQEINPHINFLHNKGSFPAANLED